MRGVFTGLLAAAVLVAVVLLTTPKPGPRAPQVDRAQQRAERVLGALDRAVAEGAPGGIRTLLVRGFVYTGPDGETMDREAFASASRSGRGLAGLQHRLENARGYRRAIVTSGLYSAVADSAAVAGSAAPVGDAYRFSATLVYGDEEWRVASLHLSRVAEPPGRAQGR